MARLTHTILAALSATLLVAATGCPPRVRVTNIVAPIDSPSVENEFALSPGDVFEMKVYGEADLSGAHKIAPDGTVNFPLVGPLKVAGMLPGAIEREMQDRLRKGFLRNPQVSIYVKEQLSKKIIVLGQVARPGTYPYVANMTVVEGITVAGGFTAMAAKNDTTVTREEQGKKTSAQVRVAEISEGKASNYLLRPGDMILVPERIF